VALGSKCAANIGSAAGADIISDDAVSDLESASASVNDPAPVCGSITCDRAISKIHRPGASITNSTSTLRADSRGGVITDCTVSYVNGAHAGIVDSTSPSTEECGIVAQCAIENVYGAVAIQNGASGPWAGITVQRAVGDINCPTLVVGNAATAGAGRVVGDDTTKKA
jgi:hypothetical protein